MKKLQQNKKKEKKRVVLGRIKKNVKKMKER